MTSVKGFTLRRAQGAFTLIELLVVVAVIGALSAGVLAALKVTTQIGKANLAKAKTFSASVENSLAIDQVGKWSFEESGLPFNDTSGYGNNALGSGSTWVKKSAEECGLGFGGCVYNNGASNIQILSTLNSSFNFSSAYTIMAWVMFDNVDNHLIITRTDYLNSSTSDWRLAAFSDGSISFQVYVFTDGVGGFVDIATTPENFYKTGQWYHVLYTWDGLIAKGKLFINGQQKAFSDSPSNNRTTSWSSLYMISDFWGSSLKGWLDEVSLYKQALTAQNIQQLYVRGLSRHLLAKKLFP